MDLECGAWQQGTSQQLEQHLVLRLSWPHVRICWLQLECVWEQMWHLLKHTRTLASSDCAVLACRWYPGGALIFQTLSLNEKVYTGVESNLGHWEMFIAESSGNWRWSLPLLLAAPHLPEERFECTSKFSPKSLRGEGIAGSPELCILHSLAASSPKDQKHFLNLKPRFYLSKSWRNRLNM